MDDITKKILKFEKIKDYLEEESLILAEEVINNRLRQKKILREKINILFICHRPTVWNSLKTVYQAFKEDDSFNVSVLAIPNKKQLPDLGLSHEIYESEGAEKFWNDYGCIQGYDYDTEEWRDPREFRPDYVFFQQPYNIERSRKYKSWIVSKYAKICYVEYGYYMGGEEIFSESHPIDFMKSSSFVFASDSSNYSGLKSWFDLNGVMNTKLIISGFPKFDLISHCQYDNSKNVDNYTALWTPRWSTTENNCFFFEYKDKILKYCDENPEFNLIFRPHPQAFLEWNARNELTEDEAKEYIGLYEKKQNAEIDKEKDYLVTFQRVDCFITDFSSLMAEYLLTGKPIIYCHRTDKFTDMGKKISEGFYWVHNFDELTATLNMLREKKDPLKEKRLEIISKLLYIPAQGAGNLIKNIIKKDALK